MSQFQQLDQLMERQDGMLDVYKRQALELAPEGTGYRARTRFSKFFNLPELMNLFKEVADIKTADQLHLPTPQVEYHNCLLYTSHNALQDGSMTAEQVKAQAQAEKLYELDARLYLSLIHI